MDGAKKHNSGDGNNGVIAYNNNPILSQSSASANIFNETDLKKMTAPQLKELLKNNGLRISGVKRNLINRLLRRPEE